MRKLILLGVVMVFFTKESIAQFTKLELKINGLTCSQCSRSVEIQLKKIKWIQSVTMDLENTIATIQVDQKATIALLEISNSVKDAGFSIGSITTEFDPARFQKVGPDCYQYKNTTYQYIGKETLHNPSKIVIIHKDFMTKKGFRPYINLLEICKSKSEIYFFNKKND